MLEMLAARWPRSGILLVGLDVGWNPATTSSATVREILNEMGRHGQKNRLGYYDYDENRKGTPSPVALKVIEDFAAKQGIRRRAVSDEEIHDRLPSAIANERAYILDGHRGAFVRRRYHLDHRL